MSTSHPDLILGTAGHIDHGKSALVKALTGTDPDRLAEEKKRGITIQLGFAQLALPDGRTMGVVDVPGHERFVRQMIAGATGMDVALLVIAADDGVMPQTVEHIAVLQMLGVRTCVVALTKADLVDVEWLDFVADEVRQRLASTPYGEAPIVAVSSVTGQGLDDLLRALQSACDGARKVAHGDVMRLPVDRVFTIKGAGTVATGTLWSGEIAYGDEVEVVPGGKRSRVRSVQIHGKATDKADAGNRVAVNIADLSTDEVRPGDILAEPRLVRTTDRFDCRITYLDTASTGKALPSGARMHIAHGTREVIGRVLLCDGVSELKSGNSVYAQVRLEEQLAVRCGDRFIMRTYSPVHVAGGGVVLLARPKRRTNLKEGEADVFACLLEGSLGEAAVKAVALQPFPVTAQRLSEFIGTARPALEKALDKAVEERRIAVLGDSSHRLYTTNAVRQRLLSKMDRTLIEFHSVNPTEAGMSSEALRRKCFPNMQASVFAMLVEAASDAGLVVSRGGLVGHPSAQGSAAQALENAADALAALLAEQGMAPEQLGYLAEHAGVAPGMVGKAATELVESGRAYRLAPDLLFDMRVIEEAKHAIRSHLAAGGAGTVAALRDVMGTSRKYAVPLLEKFDAEHFTKRDGDERSLY